MFTPVTLSGFRNASCRLSTHLSACHPNLLCSTCLHAHLPTYIQGNMQTHSQTSLDARSGKISSGRET